MSNIFSFIAGMVVGEVTLIVVVVLASTNSRRK